MNIVTRLIGILGVLFSCITWAQTAPDVSFDSFTDKTSFKLSELHGKVVYVDFWASWCGPCRKSLPLYENIYQQYKDQGLVILGVNLDQVEKDALRFMEKLEVSYPLVKGNDVAAKAFGVSAMPSSFLIGRDGNILHKHLGFRKGDEELIKKWIEESL